MAIRNSPSLFRSQCAEEPESQPPRPCRFPTPRLCYECGRDAEEVEARLAGVRLLKLSPDVPVCQAIFIEGSPGMTGLGGPL